MPPFLIGFGPDAYRGRSAISVPTVTVADAARKLARRGRCQLHEGFSYSRHAVGHHTHADMRAGPGNLHRAISGVSA